MKYFFSIYIVIFLNRVANAESGVHKYSAVNKNTSDITSYTNKGKKLI